MAAMKRVKIMGLVCRNRRCPWWRDKEKEHCRSPLHMSEGWIKKYCERQPKEEEKKEAAGGPFSQPGR